MRSVSSPGTASRRQTRRPASEGRRRSQNYVEARAQTATRYASGWRSRTHGLHEICGLTLSQAAKKSGPPPAMLVMGLLAAEEEPRGRAVLELVKRFGPLSYLSEPMPFKADYYQAEMGGPLTRRMTAFLELVEGHQLAEIKAACMELEAELALGESRRVNIDPGLLTADALILATHKHTGHRITLRPGIHAEITLWYHHGEFHPQPWTYPDFAGEGLKNLLAVLRRRYRWQLAQLTPHGGDSC